MKKKIVVLAMAIVVGMSGAAMAAGSNTVAVSGTVLGTCSITGGTAALGLIDPAGVGPVSAVVTQPQVTCSNGTPYTITDDDGTSETGLNANRMTDGTNFIAYSFTYTGAGTGTGLAVNMDVAASVAQLDYAGKPAGVYNDTVTLTVTP